MSADGVDKERRWFLTASVGVVGAAGAAAGAIPFVSSMQPSEKAKSAGAPVEVDVSKLEPGGFTIVKWRGKPVMVVRRTSSMVSELASLNDQLADPDSGKVDQQPGYAQNEHRSIKPEFFVMESVCTHLGCSPTYRPDVAPEDLGPEWKGGFFCPCHGSRFDLAGRVYKSVPAPDNMKVPPYHFVNDSLILIGEDGEAA